MRLDLFEFTGVRVVPCFSLPDIKHLHGVHLGKVLQGSESWPNGRTMLQHFDRNPVACRNDHSPDALVVSGMAFLHVGH